MTVKERQKTLHYKRANWHTNPGKTLEQLIYDAEQRSPSVDQRNYEHLEGTYRAISIEKDSLKGVYLHITYQVDNQPTTIVPKPKPVRVSKLKENQPPAEHDYMAWDAMLYVVGDHVVMCANGTKDSSAENYIREFLFKTGVCSNALENLKLMSVADAEKIKLIQDEGIRELGLNTSLYGATLDFINVPKDWKEKLFAPVIERLNAAIIKDKGPSEIKKQSEIQVALSVSMDGRIRGDDEIVTQQRLQDLSGLFLDDDAFYIKTKEGKIITKDQVSLNKSYKIKAFGNSVDSKSAWIALKKYHEYLANSGVLRT